MSRKGIYLLVICCWSALWGRAEETVLLSPDERYRLVLDDVGGQVQYRLWWNNKEVICPSRLGIRGGGDWNGNLLLGAVKESRRDTVWHPVYGERSAVTDRCNAYEVEIKRKNSGDRILLDVRAYNEGVAFRYRFPGNNYLKITDEYTEFSIPEGTKGYFTGSAQGRYAYVPVDAWKGEAERPLLLRLPDSVYVCLTEAQVTDYVRTRFVPSASKRSTLRTSMYGPVEEIAPYFTPWRVIMCASKPGELLENNDIVLNLNPSCRIGDTSWIKPGKVMREVTLSTEGAKKLVDFAVKRKLQYIHFDAGWYGHEYEKSSDATTVTVDPRRNPKPNPLNLPEVIAYARERGIGVFLYVNQRALQQQLDELLPLYQSWGVAGIKFGFVQVGSQVWTKWLHEAVAKCARYHLMVDIHDEYRPTGFSRTYPNLLTQEGIRGNEEFPDADHNTILPFTRFVAGAADYTICYYRRDFSKQSEENTSLAQARVLRDTPCHQMALSVIYYSPLQFLYWYDQPSDAQDEPELKFFDDLYTTWDETKVLQGEVGEYVAVARRKGKEWFVGAITNNTPRTLTLDLGFLPEGVKYQAEIYTDGGESVKTRTHVALSTRKVNRKSALKFDLKASGGVALRLVEK